VEATLAKTKGDGDAAAMAAQVAGIEEARAAVLVANKQRADEEREAKKQDADNTKALNEAYKLMAESEKKLAESADVTNDSLERHIAKIEADRIATNNRTQEMYLNSKATGEADQTLQQLTDRIILNTNQTAANQEAQLRANQAKRDSAEAARMAAADAANLDSIEKLLAEDLLKQGSAWDENTAKAREHISALADREGQRLATGKISQGAYDEYMDTLAKVAEAEMRVAENKDLLKHFQEIAALLSQVATAFQAFGGSMSSVFGQALTGLSAGLAGIEGLAKSKDVLSTAGSLLGTAAGVYKSGSALGGAETGALMGFDIGGPMGGAIGAAAGGLLGLLGGIFNTPEYKKVMEDVGSSWGVSISEGLAKKIQDTETKDKVSRHLAGLLNLDAIMKESGAPSAGFADKVSELIDAVSKGAVPAAAGISEIGKAFKSVSDEAIAAQGFADAATVKLIQDAKDAGLAIPEMTKFVAAGVAEAAKGLDAVVANFKPTTEQDARDLATLFSSVFYSEVAQSGILGAAQAMQKTYDAMRKGLKDAGLDDLAQVLFAPFAAYFDFVQTDVGKKSAAIMDGVTQMLKGMTNAGIMTADTFKASEDILSKTFQDMVTGGLSSHDALLAIAPTLGLILQLSKEFGFSIDENTQKLMDQAAAQGIAFPTDPMEKVIDLLQQIANLLQGLPAKKSIDIDVNEHHTGGGGPTGGGEGGGGGNETPAFQHGGFVPATPGGKLVRVSEGGEGEYVVPASQARSLGETSINVTYNPTINVYGAGNESDIRAVIYEAIRQNQDGISSMIQRVQQGRA